eukprot:scaffold19538_cov66-Phaeocystis_antarctica.AAC.1
MHFCDFLRVSDNFLFLRDAPVCGLELYTALTFINSRGRELVGFLHKAYGRASPHRGISRNKNVEDMPKVVQKQPRPAAKSTTYFTRSFVQLVVGCGGPTGLTARVRPRDDPDGLSVVLAALFCPVTLLLGDDDGRFAIRPSPGHLRERPTALQGKPTMHLRRTQPCRRCHCAALLHARSPALSHRLGRAWPGCPRPAL